MLMTEKVMAKYLVDECLIVRVIMVVISRQIITNDDAEDAAPYVTFRVPAAPTWSPVFQPHTSVWSFYSHDQLS